jgi:hypothetical protein
LQNTIFLKEGNEAMNVGAVEVRSSQFHHCVTILSNVSDIAGLVWEMEPFHTHVIKKTPLHRWLDPKNIHNNDGAAKVEALSRAACLEQWPDKVTFQKSKGIADDAADDVDD